MIGKIRKHLRLSSQSLDEVIIQLVQTCLADLRVGGIVVPDYAETRESYGNAIIDSAIIMYVKAYFGNEIDQKMVHCYEHLKNTLIIGGDAIAG